MIKMSWFAAIILGLFVGVGAVQPTMAHTAPCVGAVSANTGTGTMHIHHNGVRHAHPGGAAAHHHHCGQHAVQSSSAVLVDWKLLAIAALFGAFVIGAAFVMYRRRIANAG